MEPTLRERFARSCPGAFFLAKDEVTALTSYLRERSFLGKNEALLRVGKPGEGNMNLTLRVETDRRSFIVKQARPWVEKYPQLDAPWDRALHEARFYEMTTGLTAVAGKMPRVLAVDEDSRVLILEDLGTDGDFSSLYQGGELSAEDLAALSGFLSSLHALESGVSLPNRELRAMNHGHIFQIPLLAENSLDLDAMTPGLAAAAGALKRNDLYVQRSTELGEIYLSDGPTLLHGDFFPGSWLRTSGGLRVIDPEFAHFGRVEFELGVLRAHFILSRQDDASWEWFLGNYRAPDAFDTALMRQFAGVEIMRRVIGYAQLPLKADLAEKEDWLARSVEMLLG